MMSAHALSHALARKETYVDLGLTAYVKYFKTRHTILGNRVLFVKSRQISTAFTSFLSKVDRVCSTLFGYSFVNYYQVGWVHTELHQLQHNRNVLLLKGEGFRDTENLAKQSYLIREVFKLKEPYSEKIISLVKRFRDDDNTILVGIHMRRGDYRYWMDGKYFFEDSVYKEAIEQFENINPYWKIKFLLFSDESIIISNFGASNVIASNQEMIIDLYLMAKCDYIIGPISTFSGWASFCGQVPLFHLGSTDINMKMEDFRVYSL